MLAARRGSCLGLGAVVLMVAERMGLPLDGVRVPGHFFVRTRGPSARNVELVLPETGVCSTSNSSGESAACCGTTAAALLPVFNTGDAQLLPVLGAAALPSAALAPNRTGLITVSLVTPAATNSCCSADEQTACCEPADKASCCGSEAALTSSGCGCR